ncbi:YchJ family protein [Aestuariimicrobium sp. T2.26MG-19.2B]|uniref:YchJ family protein n=1 Tax=Aestuariimicrobium sp. T2.26MG-19.2B TaxID=3040679 RepID=UPI002540C563|nr:YchJ family metal-binding protein [Aestuariimicrobium sp. T2.26MG-19.2B]
MANPAARDLTGASSLARECACGGGDYGRCCGPIHLGTPAETAEQLMRSRYSTFVLGLGEYLVTTWHPSTRPDHVDTAGVVWTGLDIVDVVDGGAQDSRGVVEFVAHHTGGDLHERSRFERRAGRWFYLDGTS